MIASHNGRPYAAAFKGRRALIEMLFTLSNSSQTCSLVLLPIIKSHLGSVHIPQHTALEGQSPYLSTLPMSYFKEQFFLPRHLAQEAVHSKRAFLSLISSLLRDIHVSPF